MSASSPRFTIREPDGTTCPLEPGAFPLAVGGTDAAIAVPGTNGSEPLAHLGLSDGELFVQPKTGRVLCNGSAVTSSQWLHDGDVLSVGSARIEIHADDSGFRFLVGKAEEKATDPPILSAPTPSSAKASSSRGETVEPIAFQPKPLAEAMRPRRRLGVGALVFWGVLLLLGGAAWAIFNARAVVVEIEPSPESLRIEGSPFVVELGGRFLMHPGRYTVMAERDGYRKLEAPLEISEERHQRFEFAMQRLPGRLAIATVPEEGASVTIDGSDVGTTPLPPVELEPGPHQVRVRASGYRELRTEVVIEGEGTLVNLEAVLEPRWAPITFQSEPGGATVRVAGNARGSTPTTANVIEGTHDYEIQKRGYKPYRGTVHVVAGEPQRLSPVKLSLVEGTLELLSVPEAANVTVDGEYRGQTPLDVELTPGQRYHLEVSRVGYDPITREVSVESSKTETMTVRLEPRLGEIELVVDPPDAELYIDGEHHGPAQRVLRLPAAPHRIEIRKDDYESFATDVIPKPGFPQTIEVDLKTSAEVKAASIRPVIHTSKGHELRLIQPKRFEMGASRREPGRRANESLRTVEITRPFYLSTMEISNRQFREFRSSHRSGAVQGHNLEVDHHPVVRVTWQDAAAYCNWLSEQESLPPAYVNAGGKLVPAKTPTTGYRLPTEAEWALAARYPAGAKIKYPWGNALPVAPASGNYADDSAQGLVVTTVPGYDDTFPVTAPVDSFAPNALGIFNLGGNVAEWVQDRYTIYPSGAREVMQDPMGPNEGEFYTIRGASWMHGSVTQLRLTYRDYGNKPRPDVGFRIARYLE